MLRCVSRQMTALTTVHRAQLSLCCPPSLAEVCELALTTKSREQNIGTRHDIDTSFRLLLTFDCLYSYNAGKSMIQALPASVCQPQANAPVGRIAETRSLMYTRGVVKPDRSWPTRPKDVAVGSPALYDRLMTCPTECAYVACPFFQCAQRVVWRRS